MVDQALVQRHVAKGYKIAAGKLGAIVQQIRPTTALLPLTQTPLLSLLAVFDQDPAFGMAASWSARKNGGYEGYAMLDSTDVLAGDILVGSDTYFVSRFEPIRPVQVVLTNVLFDVLATLAAEPAGAAPYQGRTPTTLTVVATGWPASKRVGGGGEADPAKLPGDERSPAWKVMLPAIPGVVITRQTVLRDPTGQTFTVQAANLTQFGYELVVQEDDV